MEVVLLQRVEKLGHMGEVVKVRDGYARNFLLPQGKALRASKANIARFEAQRAELEARNADARVAAEAEGARIAGKTFVVIRAASEAGALYGSVAPRDIADLARAAGFAVDRHMIVLDRPIKELGLHSLRVMLHPEVGVTVHANVARSPEEAELQATGKSIQDRRAEEEAEAEFDLSGIFGDIGAAAAEEDLGPVEVPEGRGGDDQPKV